MTLKMKLYALGFASFVLGAVFVGSAFYMLNLPIPKATELQFVLDEAHLTEVDEIPEWVEGVYNWSGRSVYNCPHDGLKLVEITHVKSSWIPEIDYSAFYCKAEKIFWVMRWYLSSSPTWWGPFVCESARFKLFLAKVSLLSTGIVIVMVISQTIKIGVKRSFRARV